MDYRKIIKRYINEDELEPLNLLFDLEISENEEKITINDLTDLHNKLNIALDYNISAYDFLSGKIPDYILEFLEIKTIIDDKFLNEEVYMVDSKVKKEKERVKKFKNDNVIVPFKRNSSEDDNDNDNE